MTSANLDAAYQSCLDMARKHYENFPVASFLLPRHLRKHVAAIYAFARQADDLADEGNMPAEQRLKALQEMNIRLHSCTHGNTSDDPMYLALANTIQQFNLPVALFSDLISAFSQDVTQHRYASFEDVLNYCKRSANPVGRLMLHLHGKTDDLSFMQSDKLCTALQLINFFQDLHQDYHEMGRIYIPLQDMAIYGITEKHFEKSINDDAMHQLMQLQYHRTSQLMLHGSALGSRLQGRFALEIRLIIAGGERILFKLMNQKNHFSRPRLTLRDKFWMLQTALLS